MNRQPDYKSRQDIPEERRWRLEDIFPSDAAWEDALTRISRKSSDLDAYRGRLGQCDQLVSALELSSQLEMDLMELFTYARMRRDEDNAAARYQDMTERVMSLLYRFQAAQAFLVPEITALPDQDVRQWMQEETRLAPYRHQLDDILRARAHTLSEVEETILSNFGPVAQGIGDTFTLLDNVEIKLGSIKDDQDQTIELSHGKFAQLREHKDRATREAAFRQMHEAFGAMGHTLSSLYATHIKSDLLVSGTRHFEDALASALFARNLPRSLYTSLIDAVHDGLPVLQRYFALRRQLLDLPDLHIHDTYITMVDMPERHYDYDQACDLLRKAFAPLGQAYLAALERHLTERWIDVYETPGKTSGAYSWGTYKSHPYVLLNYSGTLSDVFTLAHEVGHSLHTYFSSQRPYPESDYPIFLAEIASTVNENLLMQYLLGQCDASTDSGRQEMMYLLNHFLESFRLTVFRQTMFAEFEWKAHQKIEQGQSLTADSLCQMYAELLDLYFAPEVTVDDFMRWEWARIPHFYTSYYVYQYATGFSAAVALTSRMAEEGEPAVSRYLEFLGAGGSDYPLNILARAGVDLSGPEPIQAAMQRFDQVLQQMSALLPEKEA